MLETPLNTSNEPKVSDAPDETAEQLSGVLKERIGVSSSNKAESSSAKIAASVATSVKAAADAIRENSDVLANVMTKDQKAMFAGFLKDLRGIMGKGEDVFEDTQERLLDRLAQLQASLELSKKDKPEDGAKWDALIESVKAISIKTQGDTKPGLGRELKRSFFTPLKEEHFKKDSFIRKAFFGSEKEQPQRVAKQIEKLEQERTLKPAEEATNMKWNGSKNTYQEAQVALAPKTGKNFRGTGAPDIRRATPDGTVEADSFVPNKEVFTQAVTALQRLGHDKKSAEEAVTKAMKGGETEVGKVAAKASSMFKGPGEAKEYRKPEEAKTEGVSIPLMMTNAMRAKLKDLGHSDDAIKNMKPEEAHTILNKTQGPAEAKLEPTARVKYNESWDKDDSPYLEAEPERLGQATNTAEDDSPYAPEPPKVTRPRDAKGKFIKRGGLAGPDTFSPEILGPALPPWLNQSGQDIGSAGEPPKLDLGVQTEEDKTQATLEKIDEGIQDLIDIETTKAGESSSVLPSVPAVGNIAKAGAGVVGSGALATAGTAVGGLAAGFAVGEGINHLMGQQTATQTIVEHGEANQMMDKVNKTDHDRTVQKEEVAQKRGFDNFDAMMKHNKDVRAGKVSPTAVTKVPFESSSVKRNLDDIKGSPTGKVFVPTQPTGDPVLPTAKPDTAVPQTIVIKQAPIAQTSGESAVPGGVRPTDPVFLRFQDKRWTRSA